MRLYDLVSMYSWDYIKIPLTTILKVDERQFAKLKSAYHELCRLDPRDCDMSITIHRQYEGGDLLVSGINGKTNKEMSDYQPFMAGGDDLVTYSIAGYSWSEWLGMKFHTGVFDNCGDIEVVSRCLYEMTRYGYTESDVKVNLSYEMDELSKRDKTKTKSAYFTFKYLKFRLRMRVLMNKLKGKD